MRDPSTLSNETLAEVIRDIQDALYWVGGEYDANHEWECADVLDEVAAILRDAGLTPNGNGDHREPAVAFTLDQFRATRRTCDNLGEALRDECLEGSKGFTYLGSSLFIERFDFHPAAGPVTYNGEPRAIVGYNLIIGRDEWITTELADLERKLYQFAIDEGYTLNEGQAAG